MHVNRRTRRLHLIVAQSELHAGGAGGGAFPTLRWTQLSIV